MILFSVLRYELLDPENNGDLVKAIYGKKKKLKFFPTERNKKEYLITF